LKQIVFLPVGASGLFAFKTTYDESMKKDKALVRGLV